MLRSQPTHQAAAPRRRQQCRAAAGPGGKPPGDGPSRKPTTAAPAVGVPPRQRREPAPRSASPSVETGEAVLEPPVVLTDPATGLQVECFVRRKWAGAGAPADAVRCVLLPLDAPVAVLKAEVGREDEDYRAVTDAEVDALRPRLATALLQRGLELRDTACGLTARGALRYSADDILALDDGELEGIEDGAEGAELATLVVGRHAYLAFTPLDPLFFVADVWLGARELRLLAPAELEAPDVLAALDSERARIEAEFGADFVSNLSGIPGTRS